MSEELLESEVPLFDVTVSLSPGTTAEAMAELAVRHAGMDPAKAQALAKALRRSPRVKVGSAVPKERADKAGEDLSRAGLQVSITPVLSVQVKKEAEDDGSINCPACDARVILTEERQCPSCQVFVDKVTEEFLLRRKIIEQERARAKARAAREKQEEERKARQELEDMLRQQIRAEMEQEFGLKARQAGVFSGKAGVIRGVAAVALLGVAFVAGRVSSAIPGLGGPLPGDPRVAAVRTGAAAALNAKGADAATPGTATPQPGDVDKMLQALDDKGPAAQQAGTAATAGVDPVDDEPFQPGAGRGPSAGKGLTLEQAVAASTQLAGAAGAAGAAGKLAAPAGAAPAGVQAGAGGAPTGTDGAGQRGGAANQGVGVAQDPTTPTAPGQAPGSQVAADRVQVAPEVKWTLSAELAVRLAESGQTARAQEVIRALKAAPGIALSARGFAVLVAAESEVLAWSLVETGDSRDGQRTLAMRNRIATLPNPIDRAGALARAGAVLAQDKRTSETGVFFLRQASEALKEVGDAEQRGIATGELLVSMGEAVLAQASARARSGSTARAREQLEQLGDILKQAPTPASAARLLALQSRLQWTLGEAARAEQSLELALRTADRLTNPAERAAALRHVARLADAARTEAVQVASGRLQGELGASPALERAQALATLALLHSEAGLREKAATLRRQSQGTEGLGPAELQRLAAELIVRSDLAAARHLRAQGSVAESDALLRRAAGYLL